MGKRGESFEESLLCRLSCCVASKGAGGDEDGFVLHDD